MHPYREPALNPTNSMYCCVCKEHTKTACSFKHPSGIGSVNVCFNCIDDYKHMKARAYNIPMEILEKTIVLFLYFSEGNNIQLECIFDFENYSIRY